MLDQQVKFDFALFSDLTKVGGSLPEAEQTDLSPVVVYPGEVGSFQVAVKVDEPPIGFGPTVARLNVASDNFQISASRVVDVPVDKPAPAQPDAGYILTEPGLVPDLLMPYVMGNETTVPSGRWATFWVDVRLAESGARGAHTVQGSISVNGADEKSFSVEVFVPDIKLADLDIAHTNWLHWDGLAHYHQFEVLDDKFWTVVENYISSASEMGVNAILTPAWTSPLDTQIGTTRLPVQLVEITVGSDGAYDFEFTNLRKYLDICEKYDAKFIELPHLFSQWGASSAPAFYGTVAGEEKRLFSWDTPANSSDYLDFLNQLLPKLFAVIEERWNRASIITHVSDEPTTENIERYLAAHSSVADLLAGTTLIDAVSELSIAKSVPVIPVVTADNLASYTRDYEGEFWTYYCTAQVERTSNRFIAGKTSRVRILSDHLFLTQSKGFLHWGFNFYNSGLSLDFINPFVDNSAGGAFFSGDPFIVYPAPDLTPYLSIRYKAMARAMVDYRALKTLESAQSREQVMAFYDENPLDLLTVADPNDQAYTARHLAVAQALDGVGA